MSKKIKNELRSCNQCQTQMKSISLSNDALVLSDACIKPECPNFGLLQVPTEILCEYLKALKKSRLR